MIKVNDKYYSDYNIKISWGNFEAIILGEKTKGIAPFIKFNIEDNLFIGLETRLSKEMLEKISFNEKINIKKYITDITYEDAKGWISIITGKYDCYISRMNENNFKIEFYIESEEIEEININIDTNINLL